MLDKKIGWWFVLASVLIMGVIYWLGPEKNITVLLVGLTPPVMVTLYTIFIRRKYK
ncbi:hypothetical protein [Halobacillus sp. A5]|uniref:hypothetical protein n=1 Tax=Halobacillus sp. A5 TaxID=2880263 RepID=UPI0020A646E4|nr:hypothetical protein [Halobacillus sp. A5]MCP3028704.1 hypothetical protein [Halobacillus sp. A5]